MKPRKIDRVAFYARGLVADLEPYGWAERRRRLLLDRLAGSPQAQALVERANYYNRLAPGRLLETETRVRSIPRKPSYYYYDLKPLAKAFGPDLRIACLFGDITRVPGLPSIVKSRPVGPDNANSVVMKLDRLRHFTVGSDPVPFEKKAPSAVWRGGYGVGTPHRLPLIRRWSSKSRHDIGHVGKPVEGIAGKGFLSVPEQLRHRYIVSVEGHDVATNLKWILASRSLCLMTRPRFETWFMEGALKPGVHYVELRPDYEDLEEKVDYYERNPAEALAIIDNANAHWRQFLDRPSEELVSLLVLQKYFEATGQLGPGAFTDRFFG